MSAPVKQSNPADGATRELWRAAESGDVNKLSAVLARGVDVDARNEHGMTALMRAAYHGHAQIVQALLEQGADPNLTRNDKFTALALAAFFGHTETVKVLVDHGAKTEVATRFGTSPRMWAAARTFEDAARCLEEEIPVSPIAATVPPTVTTPPVVKTLSDPPEIWDLVQVVPPKKRFNARNAFASRIGSSRVVVGAFAALVLIAVCAAGAWVLRDSRAKNGPSVLPPAQAAAEVTNPQPVAVQNSEPIALAPVEDTSLSAHVVKKPAVARQSRQRPAVDIVFSGSNPEPPVVPPAVLSPPLEKPKSSDTTAKSAPKAPLSPQLIAPAKEAASPKAKVIQWP